MTKIPLSRMAAKAKIFAVNTCNSIIPPHSSNDHYCLVGALFNPSKDKKPTEHESQGSQPKQLIRDFQVEVKDLQKLVQQAEELKQQGSLYAIQTVKKYEDREKQQPDCWDSLRQYCVL